MAGIVGSTQCESRLVELVLRGFLWQIVKITVNLYLVWMNDLNQHYRDLLGLDDSWTVANLALDLDQSEVVIELARCGLRKDRISHSTIVWCLAIDAETRSLIPIGTNPLDYSKIKRIFPDRDNFRNQQGRSRIIFLSGRMIKVQ